MKEPVTVGLSINAHAHLVSLESEGFFSRMADAYRFAIALGVSHEAMDLTEHSRKTIFNVGSLDPDRSIYEVVAALRTRSDEPVYRTVERYAEWGVEELIRLSVSGDIDFGTLLKDAEIFSEN